MVGQTTYGNSLKQLIDEGARANCYAYIHPYSAARGPHQISPFIDYVSARSAVDSEFLFLC